MSRKKIIWLILLAVVVAGAWYGYREYNRIHVDYRRARPDFTMSAADLINEYERNDSLAAKKYNGRSIEVYGHVKAIEKDERGFYTVILGDGASLSAVRCSIDTTHAADAAELMAGSSATLRGACTGFNRDEMGLGSDVIINYCAVIPKKD